MPRYKLINDKRVQLSAEEEALEDAKEKEFNDNSKNRKLEFIKELRMERLKETDWYSSSDVTMPDNIKTWRQQLRDLPQTYTTEAEYDTLLETEGEFPNQTLKHVIWSKP